MSSIKDNTEKDKERLEIDQIKEFLTAGNRSELIQILDKEELSESSGELISQLQLENSTDLCIKLLWCYLKIKESELPNSFIGSSLAEDINSNKSSFDKKLIPLATFVYEKILNKLQEEKEYRLGLLVVEPFINAVEKFELKDSLSSLISKIISLEEESLVKRKESKDYYLFLEKIKNQIKLNKIEQKTNTEKESVIEQVTETTKNKLLSTEFTLGDPSSYNFPDTGSVPNTLNNYSENLNEVNDFSSPKKSKNKYFFLLASLLLLFLVLFFKKDFFLKRSSISDKISYNPTAEDIKVSPINEILPDLNQLDKKYSFDDLTERLVTNNPTSNIPKEIKVSPDAVSTPSLSVVEEKKKIDLDEVESLNKVPDKSVNEKVEPKPIPKLPDSKIVTPTDLGNTGQGNALDGSQLKSYVVEKFDPPIIYKTTAETDILSAPSLFSAKITRVQANTPIRVTSKMGQWIEIRSNGGRLGYLFSKDAIPE